MRLLAVDWGERRIGLALSDPTEVLASALETLHVRGGREAIARVAEAARTHEVEAIVVGLPLLLSGVRGEAAEAATVFADAIAAETGLAVEMLDERLTSALAQRRLHETGTHGRRAKGRVDAGAAVALLETWMARRALAKPRPEEAP